MIRRNEASCHSRIDAITVDNDDCIRYLTVTAIQYDYHMRLLRSLPSLMKHCPYPKFPEQVRYALAVLIVQPMDFVRMMGLQRRFSTGK